jgi:DNA-binding transcriptional ArsR family regulator
MRTKRAAAVAPNDLDAEAAVLGAVLIEDGHGLVPTVVARLNAEDFYTETHRIVFLALRDMAARGLVPDPLTVISALQSAGHDVLFGQPVRAVVAHLHDAGAIPAYVPQYIDRIVECRTKRDIQQLAAKITTEATNGAKSPEILESARGTLERLLRRTARGRYHPMPARELVATQPERPRALIDRLIARGTGGWIGGSPKLGKSAAALDLLIAAALGDPWLGEFAIPEPVTAVFVEEEDPEWRVHERLTAFCRGRGLDAPPQRLHVLIRAGLKIDDEAAMLEFERELQDLGAELVVWDVFRRLHRLPSGKPDDLLPLLYRLDELSRRVGCSNLILHHFRKQAATGKDFATGGERLSGSGGLWGWTENALYLTPVGKKHGHVIIEPESKDSAVEPFKAHLEVEEEPGTKRWISAKWIYDGVVEARVEKGEETRRKVLDALSGQRTVEELMVACGLAERTVRNALGTLRKDGAVDSVKQPGKAGRKVWFRVDQAPSEASAGPSDGDVPF